MQIVLLPGMDGTGLLFDAFVERLPNDIKAKAVSYPEATHHSYEQLESLVLSKLPVTEKYLIIADSFSGPIALRMASRAESNLEAIVLVSSFAYCPLGWIGAVLGRLPLQFIFRCPLPAFVFRMLLLGHSAPRKTLVQVRQAIARVHPDILAARLKEALTSHYGHHPVPNAIRVVAVFSEHDRLLGQAGRKSLSEVCPNADMETIPAPHFALQVAPDEVLSVLRRHRILPAQTR